MATITKIDAVTRSATSGSTLGEDQPSETEPTKRIASEVGDLVERFVSLLVNPAPAKPTQLLTADEVAELLNTNSQVVYKLVRNQELTAVNLGTRMLRFTESSISEFIKRGGVRITA